MATKTFNKTILQTSFTSLESIYYLLQTVKDNQPMTSADGKDKIFPQARAKIAQARGGEWSEEKRDTHAELTLYEMRLIRYVDSEQEVFEVSDFGNEFLRSFNLTLTPNEEGKFVLGLTDLLPQTEKYQFLFDMLINIYVYQPKYNRRIRPYLILFKLLTDLSLDGYISKSEWAYFINSSDFLSDYQYEEIKESVLKIRQSGELVEPMKSDRILTRLVLWNVLDRYNNTSYQFCINKDFLSTIKINLFMTGNINELGVLPIFKDHIQDIYFGSPGTGKSYKVKNDLLEGVKEEYIFRTTFHPDTDYSSFVGCYKPIATTNAVQQFSEIDDLVEQYKLDVLPAEVSKVGYIEARIKFGINYCQYFGGRFANYEINDLLEKAGMAFEGDSDKYRVGQTYIRYGVNIGLGSDLLPDAITYDFVPETFTEAYVKAWTNPTKQIYLVIEEINRGNCAQIFGDIFQLLDRKNGISEYPVKADTALANYLRKKLKGAAAKGIADGKLCLPDNFNIIATMNTSDQSLFPMDSAFKRRWGWRCIPTISPADKTKTIKFTLTKGVTTNYGTKVSAGTYEYDWTTFLECINEKIREATNSDDKQLGFWFVKTEDEEGIISAEVFVSKVVFYLWNDIFKDMGRRDNNPFSIEVGEVRKIMSYNTFFELDSDTKNVVENLGILYTFLGNLGLKPKSANLESDE